jgi:hypothetical protein
MVGVVSVFAGEDFALPWVRRDALGQPVAIANATVEAWLNVGADAVSLVVAKAAGGAFAATANAVTTSTWPAGFFPVYARYIEGGATDIELIAYAAVQEINMPGELPPPASTTGDRTTVTVDNTNFTADRAA